MKRATLLLISAACCLASSAFPAVTTGTLTLSFNDRSLNETAFEIQRAEPGASFLALATIAANATAYVDNTVQLNREYRYRVRGVNAGGYSAWSNEATGTQTTATKPPPDNSPNLLTVTPEGWLANVSTRGRVAADASTLIPGFVVADGPVLVLVRVVGPTIGQAPYSVPDTCPDPAFELRNAAGVVLASADNWSMLDREEVEAATALAGAFPLLSDKEAVAIVKLPPGNYTVVGRGVGGVAGIVLAEVYKLPQ